MRPDDSRDHVRIWLEKKRDHSPYSRMRLRLSAVRAFALCLLIDLPALSYLRLPAFASINVGFPRLRPERVGARDY